VGSCVGRLLDCPPLTPHVPENVNDLRPDDIKVIMTLGDSITAGFGIQGSSGLLNEYRGLSWSIGGDDDAITLANMLQSYSTDIQGSSLGSHIMEVCYGLVCPPLQYHPSLDVLNAAQSGAMVDDLPHELDYLLGQLSANPDIDMDEDWKLMTILMGANDLCASCTLIKGFLSPDDFEAHMSKALEAVRLSVPRVFVQIAEIFNLSQIYDLSLKIPHCATIHRALFLECDCIFGPLAGKNRAAVDTYAQLYNERSRKLAAYYQSMNYPDFNVVTQPFGRDTMITDQPPALLSTLDCFHPSLMAHEAMAIALWNNMLTPAASKQTFLNVTDIPLCPTDDTRLYSN